MLRSVIPGPNAEIQDASVPSAIRAVREPGVVPTRPPRLFDRVREAARVRHYSRRTEAAYLSWIRRFIFFHGKRHPAEMGAPEITKFLSSLAVEGNVAASGSGCSPPPGSTSSVRPASADATTFTNPCSSALCGRPSRGRRSRSAPPAIPFATRSPHTCWRTATTSARSKSS
jgi:hypothetical protein